MTSNVIFDSGPCYPSLHLAARAFTLGSGLAKKSNSFIENFVVLPAVAVTYFFKDGVERIFGGRDKEEVRNHG